MRILIVRLREIGDVVFTTPSVRALRERFPDAHISYIVEPHAAPVVERNPHLNQVIVAPRVRGVRGLAADIALGRSLRASRPDLAIDFHGGPRAGLLTWLSGAPERIGYEITGRGWMYTRRVARPRALRARHSVENQWDLLAPLGIPPPDRGRHGVEMVVDPRASADVTARLAAAGRSETERLIVIHASAGNPFRRWPFEHFVELVTTLIKETDAAVLVTSGPSEQGARERILAAARLALPPDAGARLVSCGEFSLAELRALMDRGALFIGGDSGPMHIAATSRIPVVGLFGPTLAARSAPWRDPAVVNASIEPDPLPCRPCDQRTCAPGDFRCLTTIQPGRVVEAALKCLK